MLINEDKFNMRARIRRNYRFKHDLRYRLITLWRRHPKKIMIATAVTAVVGFAIATQEDAKAVNIGYTDYKMIPVYEPVHPGNESMKVDYTYLKGKGHSMAIGRHFGIMLGMTPDAKNRTIMTDSAIVTWSESLKLQWNDKLNRKGGVQGATKAWAAKIIDAYAHGDRDTKSIGTFMRQVDTEIVKQRGKIDYGKLCSGLKIGQCSALYKVTSHIEAHNLVAYGMTELFAGQNGRFNYVALDTLLRNAGENYINSIPALYDDRLSRGLYQFTSGAVKRDDTGILGGATIADNYAGKTIPGSVSTLSATQAHRAAFMFATFNIAMMMRGMNEKDANTLASKCSMSDLT